MDVIKSYQRGDPWKVLATQVAGEGGGRFLAPPLWHATDRQTELMTEI